LLGTIALGGCRRESPTNFDRNLPPETFISGAPAESTLSYYQVHMYWNGSDPDGLIDHFEYSVTDSNKSPGEDTPDFNGYFSTASTDSLFLLSADSPQILGHRFYVRSVDNEGKVDPTPAWTYFIAHDFNFPSVDFTRSVGIWTDRFNVEHVVELTSTNKFDPTDTIGVGGCFELAWSGSDRDVGGRVVGFEFRSSADTDFQGGSLADTSFSRCFEGDFSGKDAFVVRAIDDAGARTLPDSVRSLVINFNPIAQIVDPLSPDPVPARVFTDDSGVVRPSGTMLRDGFRRITFAYYGFDDPRDFAEDPEDPGITGFSFRKLSGFLPNLGGAAYREVGDWKEGEINLFQRPEAQSLSSGDYMFLMRSRDDLGRWGEPDTVLIRVNYPPYFVDVSYIDPQGTKQPLWIPGGTEPVTALPGLDGDGLPLPLHVQAEAIDDHSADSPHPLEITHPVVEDEVGAVAEYRVRVNGSAGGFEVAPTGGGPTDRFLPATTDSTQEGMVRVTAPGGPVNNFLEIKCKDVGGRITALVVPFRVNIQE